MLRHIILNHIYNCIKIVQLFYILLIYFEGGESHLLLEEEAGVLDQTKELAYKEYHTFIHAADCSKDMLTEVYVQLF